MNEFSFLQNPLTKKWTILAPRRAKRPDNGEGTLHLCPFCPEQIEQERVLDRIPGDYGEYVTVVPNKFPFTPIHELVIHTSAHNKHFGELSVKQAAAVLRMYKKRTEMYREKGQVYIFHNRGEMAGESIPHGHTQLTVIPREIVLDIPPLGALKYEDLLQTEHFSLFCPRNSQWPDEVWVTPKRRGREFGEILDEEIHDLAFIITRLVQIMHLRHGEALSFNFYISPGNDWYFRFVPRMKRLGGFEVGTGIFINTQDPQESIDFLRAHFMQPHHEKIKTEHQANYKHHA